jgi:methylenetetrahydrofolate dehydrogenase (NADP+)/methenyltetrahydrofolate cyclohydrolase
MKLIDGIATSNLIIQELSNEVKQLHGKRPQLVFVRVGDDPASVSYVKKKEKTAARIGIKSQLIRFDEKVSQAELFRKIDELNADPDIHGILVQAPLPAHINEIETFNRVHPDKDVDGFNTVNVGKLCQEDLSGFIACTPAGIVELIKRNSIPTQGKHVVVLGRSQIVGKPAALLMLRNALPGNATVTICHSKTKDLKRITQQADILIAAIGRPHFVTADMVKADATIIDVGINRLEDSSQQKGYRIVGDVDFEGVCQKADWITPVPGGVGPMTVAMLMDNTLRAFKRSL